MANPDNRIVPVILAGGKGTRLWPVSREARPKQFLALVDDLSLLQLTLKRVSNENIYAPPVVVTIDRGSEGAHRGGGGKDILAFKQAVDRGFADRQRPEHQRPM